MQAKRVLLSMSPVRASMANHSIGSCDALKHTTGGHRLIETVCKRVEVVEGVWFLLATMDTQTHTQGSACCRFAKEEQAIVIERGSLSGA